MKSKSIKHSIIILIILASFTGCKKDIVDDPNKVDYETDLEQFEAVWNGLNTAYVFWSVDSTDWDAVYEKYHPIFEEMDAKPDSVWDATWRELTSTLMDHHMTISLKRPSSSYYMITINPGLEEQKARPYYHERPNLFPDVHRQMLNKWVNHGKLSDTVTAYDFNTAYTGWFWCSYSGMIDNEIAYLYLSGFEMNDASAFGKMQAFEHFKELVAKDNIKAAIIDIRDNPGGDPTEVSYLLSCFTTEKKIQVGCSQTKLGLDRYDLTPKMPCYVYPISSGQKEDIPVIVLADINSVSAAETAVMAIRNLPQGYMVGERTYGAFGILNNDFELFYSGTFGLGGYLPYTGSYYTTGHYIVTAKWLFSDVDGTVYEGHGIVPDVECLFDQSAWNNGTDNQLECAVEFAKKKIEENGK